MKSARSAFMLMIRWILFYILLVLMFWSAWYVINGNVPEMKFIHADKMLLKQEYRFLGIEEQSLPLKKTLYETIYLHKIFSDYHLETIIPDTKLPIVVPNSQPYKKRFLTIKLSSPVSRWRDIFIGIINIPFIFLFIFFLWKYDQTVESGHPTTVFKILMITGFIIGGHFVNFCFIMAGIIGGTGLIPLTGKRVIKQEDIGKKVSLGAQISYYMILPFYCFGILWLISGSYYGIAYGFVNAYSKTILYFIPILITGIILYFASNFVFRTIVLIISYSIKLLKYFGLMG